MPNYQGIMVFTMYFFIGQKYKVVNFVKRFTFSKKTMNGDHVV